MEKKQLLSQGIDKYKNWHFKNTFLAVLALIVFFIVAKLPSFQGIISHFSALGYLGAFVGGLFFVSVFTIAPSAVLIFDVAQSLDPINVAIAAGLGTVIGDYLILRFLKDSVFDELSSLFDSRFRTTVRKLFATPYFAWLIPILGAAVIASPLPDEAGICLLGLSKIRTWQFLLLTFILNSMGILVIILVAATK
ncbi:MAG: hypothetical protein BWY43_00563 [candidate division WS2 bacterium ADurb.Bin280]|uniref:SNARE associated Golgi protein n=1 Tax=candidate division WS2 bacterium ADurb.Bin280 TaxID=1852829 RepID=A0A1V5SCQ1_9BACT|nr:MAG: hypothetical protein BWY43_00563 [candidate division WS2 bacterium ADurb.Bin280]